TRQQNSWVRGTHVMVSFRSLPSAPRELNAWKRRLGRLGSGLTGGRPASSRSWIKRTKSPLCLPPSADQYLGRCETAHCRACSMGACGGNAARNFRTVGCASILSRHRQKAGYFGYMAWPSLVSPKAYVLGST